jgi:hypothetical protein
VRESVNVNTLSGYRSAAKAYVCWCEVRGLDPWPADEILLAAWCVHMGTSISVPSIRGYACAIKFVQLQLSPHPWTCDGSIIVRQVLRYLKKHYGESGKATKYPVTLAALRNILPLLAGWPVAGDMSHDDRLFACASLIATSAFLRGGEFCTYPGSARSVLLGKAVRIHNSPVTGNISVVVAVPTPKNAWWLESVDAHCFTPAGDTTTAYFGPALWLRMYRKLSVVDLGELDPAFRTQDGATLSRDWMVRRTAELIARAGLQQLGPSGERIVVKASSWRSGGAMSATMAGLPGPLIMAFGRWRSIAWASYVAFSTKDLEQAAQKMWDASNMRPSDLRPEVLALQVGVPPPFHEHGESFAEFLSADVLTRPLHRLPGQARSRAYKTLTLPAIFARQCG